MAVLQNAQRNSQPTRSQGVLRRRSEQLIPYLFISPFLISFAIFFVYPSISSLVLSFSRYSGLGTARFIGFQNYAATLHYPYFWQALTNTAFYWIAHTIPLMIISFLLAVALRSKLLRGQSIFKPLLFLPQVMPVVAAALVWRFLLSGNGPLSSVFGQNVDFLGNMALARWAVVVFISWRAIGWYVVIFMAGLTTISQDIEEAAIIDGASSAQMMWRITLPLMRPIFFFALLVETVGSLQMYTEPNILIGGAASNNLSPAVMPVMNLLTSGIQNGNFGLASAIGWLLFIVILVVSLLQGRLFGAGDKR